MATKCVMLALMFIRLCVLVTSFDSLSGISASDYLEFLPSCPNSDSCSCTRETVECICDGDNDKLNIIAADMYPNTVKLITVQNCSAVSVHQNSLCSYPHLEDIVFDELDYLQIQSSGLKLSPASSLKNLVIQNVKDVRMHANELKNLTSFSVYNSSFTFLDVKALNVIGVRNVIVSNCEFSTINLNSLQFTNGAKFHMIKSTINDIRPKGISVNNFEEVVYQDTHFQWNRRWGSVVTSETTNLTIDGCIFGEEVNTSALFADVAHNVDNFNFVNNEVNRIQSNTFYNVRVNTMHFSQNTIKKAEKESIVPIRYRSSLDSGNDKYSRKNPTVLTVGSNLFNCISHDIEWILTDDFYKCIKDTSKCYAPREVSGANLNCLIMQELKNLENKRFRGEAMTTVKFQNGCDSSGQRIKPSASLTLRQNGGESEEGATLVTWLTSADDTVQLTGQNGTSASLSATTDGSSGAGVISLQSGTVMYLTFWSLCWTYLVITSWTYLVV